MEKVTKMAPQALEIITRQKPTPTEVLEASLERTMPRLYRTALRRLRNPADAQDAMQDALLAAFKHADQFEGRSDVSTWLTRIVINAASGQLRRGLAHPAASLEACTEEGRQFVDHSPSPETTCAQTEWRETLQRLMQRLSPALREAYQLCEIEGLSMRDAATRLGISAGAMKCRVFRARTQLIPMVRAALTPARQKTLAMAA